MSTTDQVLSDFIDAWNAGRRPRVPDYLARVPEGAARDELAEQLTTWLEVAPAPAYDDAARAAIRASPAVAAVLRAADAKAGLWPTVVPQLRERAGLSVRDVAARLVERFGLSREDEPRTAGYLEQLERGSLDASRVSRRLLEALGALLGAGAGTLADAGGLGGGLRVAPAQAPGSALFRAAPAAAAPFTADLETLSRAALTPAEDPEDELDRLFRGGPDA